MATDGISIRAITRNRYIRQSFFRDGFKFPYTERDVMKLIHEDYDDKKNKIKKLIESKLLCETKFSICIDEYTTVRGRRFFGLNLHCSDDKNILKLGIIRINGTCSAIDMVIAVETYLNEFGINMDKDIVASTQDGAAVNKKYIRLTNLIGQFCLNHALHLGVCDTLYHSKKTTKIENLISDNENSGDDDCFDEGLMIESDEKQIIKDEDFAYNNVLEKARQLVRFIKLSTNRNGFFLNEVKNEFGSDMELHLDIKTRWNSLISMINPLIKAKNAIYKTLEEFNAIDKMESIDFTLLKHLLQALEPIKLAVENLGRDDATLLSADKILKFMFNKLACINSDISKKLFNNLERRVNERMNDDLMDLLRCLKDNTILPSLSTLKFAENLVSRLFSISATEKTPYQQENVLSNANLSLQEELDLLLEEKDKPLQIKSVSLNQALMSEFTMFRNTGQRPETLEKLLNAILSIKPTSTDVERVFSICGNFCTKVRSRLSDKSLQALVFLKSYYNK